LVAAMSCPACSSRPSSRSLYPLPICWDIRARTYLLGSGPGHKTGRTGHHDRREPDAHPKATSSPGYPSEHAQTAQVPSQRQMIEKRPARSKPNDYVGSSSTNTPPASKSSQE
jgi:hypothetical protein